MSNLPSRRPSAPCLWNNTDLLLLVTRLCVNSQEQNLKIVKHKWNKWWAWTNAADRKRFFETAAKEMFSIQMFKMLSQSL